MKPQDYKIIQEIANNRVAPAASAWHRVREKTKRRKVHKRMFLYRNLAIAASFIAILASSFAFFENKDQINNPSFATNHLYEPAILEYLPDNNNDPFYQTEKLLHFDQYGYINPAVNN